MADEGFFLKYLFQPMKKFYRKYILREIDVLNDTQDTGSDVQENSGSLGHIQQNELAIHIHDNDII
ncbi:hypothetical protein GOY07_02015 [Wolbachia endosymbiont of Litomosoides sigmodontis]|uniref:hypothetical protein n=1 Tax=Wolbachia endosymbiont of Litomosoides sigmodontis TaxID=80850 RepID=UPI00158AF307|nr:hypothetical protein [Wolbachia endosymbiont of Litomosoides sigmodontis]QKX02973.1 hypothetical protein GOY07_02015 [Wolbachia endosymbiont of Litomosoides sigmodontis]